MRRSLLQMFGCVAVLALAGCSAESPGEPISPQPQPVLGIEVQAKDIFLTDTGTTVRIMGVAGALSAGPGSVTITNLSVTGASATGDFPKDGSFDFSLTGEPTDSFRLDATNPDNKQGSLIFTADPATGQAVPVPET